MPKPCKLQMNNSGAWKNLSAFDAEDEERTDDLMNAAAQLADVVNEAAKKPQLTLRVIADDGTADVLMHYEGREQGWRTKTGEPA